MKTSTKSARPSGVRVLVPATLQAVIGGVDAPRDAASGLATGKRQHKPVS